MLTIQDFMENFTYSELLVIFGTMLGDGNLQRESESTRLKVYHTVKTKDYVNWKFNFLKRLCETTQGVIFRKSDDTTGFETGRLKELTPLYTLFYQKKIVDGEVKNVKVITEEFLNLLPVEPLILAVWFMDDGNARTDSNAGRIATQGFTKKECELLVTYLNKFEIKANIIYNSKAKGQYTVTIPATGGEFTKFCKLIKPYVLSVPSMYKKLGKNL